MRAEVYVEDEEGRVLSDTVTLDFEVTGGRMVNTDTSRLLHIHTGSAQSYLVIVQEDFVLGRSPLGMMPEGGTVVNEEWRFVVD